MAPVGIQCVDCVNEAKAAARPVKSAIGLPIRRGRPVLTFTLIALNVAVYVAAPIFLGANWRTDLALFPAFAELEVWRWVTAAFAHEDILHIGVNMYMLFQFGSFVEPLLGRARFAVLYAGSLLGSSALIAILGSANSYHLGASGAVFGLLAAYVIIAGRLRLRTQTLMLMAGAWLLAGFFIPGLSWQGHLGGAVAGAIITALMLKGVGDRHGQRG